MKLLVTVCFLLSSFFVFADRDDSYLQKLAAAYEEATRQNDMETELAALEPYLAEAIRQQNVKEEQYARISKVYCYFNFDAFDQLYAEIDRQMDYFSQKGWWDRYYACAQLRVEALIMQDKPISALREADRLYAEAHKSGFSKAIVAAAYSLFYCYHHSGRNEEAATIFQEILDNRENIPDGEEGNYYTTYSDVLYSLKRYDDLLKHAQLYEETVDQVAEESRRKGVVSDYQLHRFYVNLSYANAYLGLKQLDKVVEYYDKALPLARDRRHDQILIKELHIDILQRRGDYDEALAEIHAILNDPEARPNQSIRNYHLSMKADILYDAARYDSASVVYRQIIELTDSIARADMLIQLNDLRSIYQLDQLTKEKEQAHFRLLIAFLVCIAMSLIITLYIIYSRRLKAKNRILFERIEEQTRLEQERRQVKEVQPTVVAPLEPTPSPRVYSELFARCTEVLSEEKPHLSSDFSRDQLVERLGTNKNKLTDAVSSATGYNLMEYVTKLRLQEALLLMENQPTLSLAQIAEQSGFGVYSSFYRAFYKQYGVKPTEYRTYRNS